MREKYMKGTVVLLKSGSTGTEFVAMYGGHEWTLDGYEESFDTLEDLLVGEFFEVVEFLRGGLDKVSTLDEMPEGSMITDPDFADIWTKDVDESWYDVPGDTVLTSASLADSEIDFLEVTVKNLW